MTTLQTFTANSGAATQINELVRSLSAAGLYGIDPATTTGLTLGFYGGEFNGVSVADGTVALTASNTNYVVAHRTTGAVTAAITTTNWLDTATYLQLYQLVAGASTFTIATTSDKRQAYGAAASGAGTGDVVGPASAVSGRVATFDGATGKVIQDGGTLLSDLAPKTYVDAAINGLSWKQAVRAATTVAGTLASSFEDGDSIDGVTLVTGDRILIKNQASGSENGIYTVNASGAPARASDADSGAELVNASVYVSEGTTLADTQWTCSTNAPITIGVTSISFAQVTGGGSVSWGAITGTLSSQSDLQAALDLKQARSPSIQSVVSSATVTPTFSNDMVKITAQATGLTIANPTGTAIDGLGLVIRIKDDGTARTIAYGTQYRAIGVTLPATTVVSKTLYLAMVWNSDDTKFDVVAVGQEA